MAYIDKDGRVIRDSQSNDSSSEDESETGSNSTRRRLANLLTNGRKMNISSDGKIITDSQPPSPKERK